MKLSKEYLIHTSSDETILVPTGAAGFAGIVRGNRTFGAILELLKEDIGKQEIIASLRARFDAPEGAVERDVEKALEELRRIGALDEQP